MKKIEIYMAHSHEVFAYGLYQGLANLNCTILKMDNQGIDALHYIIENAPKIAILESDLPLLSAFDIMKTVAEKQIETKFIIIFPSVEAEHLVIARALHFSGTVYMGDSFKSVLECIKKVDKGKTHFSDSFIPKMDILNDPAVANLELLSETEINVLSLITPYKNSAVIAKVLKLSERTIEKHRSNIIKKLKLDKKTNSLTKWAMKNHVLIRNIALRSPT
jgi:DNA-binding NarL/FixJ family response regulator